MLPLLQNFLERAPAVIVHLDTKTTSRPPPPKITLQRSSSNLSGVDPCRKFWVFREHLASCSPSLPPACWAVALAGLALKTKGAQASVSSGAAVPEAPSPVNSHSHPLLTFFSIEISAFFWLICQRSLNILNVNPLKLSDSVNLSLLSASCLLPLSEISLMNRSP